MNPIECECGNNYFEVIFDKTTQDIVIKCSDCETQYIVLADGSKEYIK